MTIDPRLIAAAPAMLKALQRLTHPMADDEDLRDALAVIARATGQPVPEEPDAFPPDDDGPLEPDEYSDEAADAAEDKWLAARAAPYAR